MDVEEIAELCSAPFSEARPVVMPGAIGDPDSFFGEDQFQHVIADSVLLRRAMLCIDQSLASVTEFPGDDTWQGIQRHLARGAGLLLRGLQHHLGPVRDTCLGLAKYGWTTVHGVCSETPAGVQGLPPQWNVDPMVVLQIRSREVWYIFDRLTEDRERLLAEWISRGCGFELTDAERACMTPDAATFVAVLSPGDGLFIPPGCPAYSVGVGDIARDVRIYPLSWRVIEGCGNEDHTFDLRS